MNLVKMLGGRLPMFQSSLTSLLLSRSTFPAAIHSVVGHQSCPAPGMLSMKTQLQLIPASSTIIPHCGMKQKGKIRLRCRDCYFVRREGRMYVMCPSYGRHKQMEMVAKPKKTWILSHACQSKSRPY